MSIRAPSAFLSVAAILAFAQVVHAQEPPAAPVNETEDVVQINGNGGSTGRVAVNAAAGNLNQQANVGVIAIGDSAVAIGSVTQITDAPVSPPAALRSAIIADNAFAGSSGMIAVNVAAGSGHQQANVAIFAIGIEGPVVTDATLSQTRASNSPSGGSDQSAGPDAVVGVSSTAFAGSSGLVQVSLVGGERNSSANLFVLTTSEGANP